MKTKAKAFTSKLWTYTKLIGVRAIGAMILGGLGIFIGYQIDYANVERTPATEYMQYTQFTVQNARVNEDVNFNVCRDYQRPYLVESNINIYVIQNPGTEQEKPVAVYGRTNSTTLNGNCESKIIRNEDFHHQPGEYEIRGCVDFNVRYDIPKQVCETSNRYRIYETPRNLQEQIDDLENQLKSLEQQRAASEQVERQSVAGGGSSTTNPSTSQPATQQPAVTPIQPETPTDEEDEEATPPPATRPCVVSVLGLNLLCR